MRREAPASSAGPVLGTSQPFRTSLNCTPQVGGDGAGSQMRSEAADHLGVSGGAEIRTVGQLEKNVHMHRIEEVWGIASLIVSFHRRGH